MPSGPGHRVSVFIVEDSAIFRDRLKRLLAEQAWIDVVGEAEDVAGTLAALESIAPDVLLLDLHLTGGGYSILEVLKRRQTATTVVVLTADASAAVRQLCSSRGADAVIAKIDTDTGLLPVLRRVADAAHLRAEGGAA